MKDKHYSRCTPYTTKSGLQIGSAYIPPAQLPTQDGELIQSVLLGDRPHFVERKGMMVYAFIVAVVFIFFAVVL